MKETKTEIFRLKRSAPKPQPKEVAAVNQPQELPPGSIYHAGPVRPTGRTKRGGQAMTEKPFYPVIRCGDCGQVTFSERSHPASACGACGGVNVRCDHPGSIYSRAKAGFVCGDCGHIDRQTLPAARRFIDDILRGNP